MSENGRKAPIEQALEIAVYAPIGFALYARDVVPPMIGQFVTRGRQEVEQLGERVDNQVGQARVVGQFAVEQGREQVKKELAARLEEVRERGGRLARDLGIARDGGVPSARSARSAPASASARAPRASAPDRDRAPAGDTSADAATLAIPDYDELSASQVVARLSGLSASELEAVRAYESSRRRRKTILTKIEQLTR